MTRNYYPLRVGKHGSVIVSDVLPQDRASTYKKADMDSEWNHYGGFIIAESVPPEMAQALVDAYNEKYAPENRDKELLEKKFDSLFEFACKKLNTGELVYNYQDNTWRLPYNSAHSFTEGAEPVQSPAVEGDPKPTPLDDLVNRIGKQMIETSGYGPSAHARTIVYALEEYEKLKNQK
jgi:hypothetical protein